MHILTVLLAVPVVIYLLALVLWKIIRRSAIAKNPGLPEFECINQLRHKRQGSAVICGGSIAGLLAARICSEYFERVIIIEPEAWLATEEARGLNGWEQSQPRTRVIQYRSLLALPAIVLEGLSKLFPGFSDEAIKSDMMISSGDWQITFGGTILKKPRIPLPDALTTTRAGFETLLRRMVLGKGMYPNIEQVAGIVTGLIPNPDDHSRILKVSLRTESNIVLELEAELIADCTGMTRGGFKWLDRLGYGPVRDTQITIDQKLHYLTMVVDMSIVPGLSERLPIPTPGPIHYTFLEHHGDDGKKNAIMMRPNSKCMMLFAGCSGGLPVIKSLDDMAKFLQGMTPFRDPVPQWVYDTIEMLQEVEDTAVYSKVHVPATSYIQYHLAEDLPSNFVALGDSTMTLNPSFGQGCQKALMGAMELNHALRTTKKSTEHLPKNFSKRFFTALAAKTGDYWDGTRGADYGIPTTVPVKGDSLSDGTTIRAYIRRLQYLALTDEEASSAFLYNIQGYGCPLDFFHPSLILKVLWSMITTPTIE